MLIYERRINEYEPHIKRPKGVSEELAALLYARGARDEKTMEAFLDPLSFPLHSPFLLSDMEKAITRIRAAISLGEEICVYGDYDADGVCATSILYMCLQELGANVRYHIPNRHAEGYGMNVGAVEKLCQEGVKLIVTVDNGIKSVEEIARAAALGMDVVVTDHHKSGDTLPACAALVCSSVGDYQNPDLCGAGIAYKLALALTGEESIERYLILAGLATVSDVVPLVDENRALVARALRAISAGKASVGLSALLAVGGVKGAVDARTLGFVLAPRLNAAGRLKDARLSVELLTEKSEARALELAKELDALNTQRKKEEQAILQTAYERAEEVFLTNMRSLVLFDEGWNMGVVGIAAARLAEKYYRPTLLLAEKDGLLTGSARSVPGVDLYGALKRCETYFERFGGHSYAAGVTMKRENLEGFIEAFEQALRETASDAQFLPRKQYELKLSLPEVTEALAYELTRLEPFGEGNPEPLVLCEGVELLHPKRIGGEGAHLSFTAAQGGAYLPAVGFGLGQRLASALDAERLDLLFTPKMDSFNSMSSLKLFLAEMRPSPVENAAQYLSRHGEKFIDAISANVLYNSSCGPLTAFEENAFETAAALIENSFAGVAVLCFTQGGAGRFMALASKRGLLQKMDVRFYKNDQSACAYHTLLLAPVLDALSLERFTSVVLFDAPPLSGAYEKLKALAKNARLYAGKGIPDEGRPLCEALALDRAVLAAHYRALRAANRAFYNRASALDSLREATGDNPYRTALALSVMEELGFITLNEKGNIEPLLSPAQRALEESATFRACAALLKAYEEDT